MIHRKLAKIIPSTSSFNKNQHNKKLEESSLSGKKSGRKSVKSSPANESLSSSSIKPRKSQTAKASKKKVTFHRQVRCKVSLHLNNFTDEEIDACWYTPREYKAMKKQVNRTVKVMELSDCDKAAKEKINSSIDQYCTRGLEHRTFDGRMQRLLARDESLYAVLEWQSMQDIDGHNNPSEIALAYMKISETSQQAANQRGILDAEQARQQA